MLSTLRFIWNHPLASKRRLAAVSRYLRWQLGVRVLPHPVVMPFGEKATLVVERSMTGATGNIYTGLHEFEDMAFALHFLRATDCFVDVGANVGSYTILASKTVGAKSICIEPIPQTFAKLRRNILCNDLTEKVTALQCVIGAQPGQVRFSADRDTMNQVVDERYKGESLLVEVDTLDNLLINHHASMWKIDVEGFESRVLAGAQKALCEPSLNAVLLETNDPDVTRCMQDAGFQPMMYSPFERRLSLGAIGKAGNTLWIRQLEFAQERCASAPKWKFAGIDV